MYTLNIASGVVTRDRDGKVISPCQSYDDQDHISYIGWVEAGHEPTIVDVPELSFDEVKRKRQELVDAIVVTVTSGRQFDGDETSQDSMARAITSLDDGESTMWVLATSQVAMVSRSELREALRLAGAEMTRIWTSIY